MDFEEGGSTKWLLDPGCDHWIRDILASTEWMPVSGCLAAARTLPFCINHISWCPAILQDFLNAPHSVSTTGGVQPHRVNFNRDVLTNIINIDPGKPAAEVSQT